MPENKFAVGVLGDRIGILKTPDRYLSKEEALNLAAWLIALSTLDYEKEFLPLLKAVQNC